MTGSPCLDVLSSCRIVLILQMQETLSTLEIGNVIEESLTFKYHRGADHYYKGPHAIIDGKIHPFAVLGQVRHASFFIRIEGGPLITIAPGGGYLLPPGVKAVGEIRSPDKALLRWSHINFWLLGTIDLFSLLETPYCFDPRAGGRIGLLIKALQAAHDPQTQPTIGTFVRRQALGLQILEIIASQSVKKEGHGFFRELSRLAPVMGYISRNLDRPLSREELARQACLSESRFHAVFKSAFGMAPLKYVQQLRLKKAQSLLTTCDLSVEAIGMEVGFNDPFHFSRLFKEFCGTSPKGYRLKSRELIAEMSFPIS